MEKRFIFMAILYGMSFGFRMFSVPVILNWHSSLNDCANHGTESGCLAGPKQDCVWLNQTCYFKDYQILNCSLYDNSSDTCVTYDDCEYRFTTKKCLHRSGFSVSEEGGFAAASVAGGSIGFLVEKFFKVGVPSMTATTILGFVAAILFSVAVETDIFAVWVIAQILASMSSFAAASLLPEILKNSNTVPLTEKPKFMMLLGSQIGIMALIIGIWFYFSTPRNFFSGNPEFQFRLHELNVIGYLIGFGYFISTLLLIFTKACECEDEKEEKEKKHHHKNEEPDQQQQHQIVSNQGEIKEKDDNEEEERQEMLESPTFTESSSPQIASPNTATAATLSLAVPVTVTKKPTSSHSDTDSKNKQLQQQTNVGEVGDSSCSCTCSCDVDRTLVWITTLLFPFFQQFSGLFALAAFLPVIFVDVTSDSILAQLLFSIFLPLGSLSSFFIFFRCATATTTFIVSAFVCCFASLVIGLALYPGIVNEDDAPGVAAFGVCLFSYAFGCGPSSSFFAAITEGFMSSPAKKDLKQGVSVAASFAAGNQAVLRLIFPIFVAGIHSDARKARAISFFCASALASIFGIIIVILIWYRKTRNIS